MAEKSREGCVQEQDCLSYCFQVIITHSPHTGSGDNPCIINASNISSNDVNKCAFWRWEMLMRTTLNIDDQLLAEAQRITGVSVKVALVREGLRALIERESARRLARLGGSEPQLKPRPRRQSDPAA